MDVNASSENVVDPRDAAESAGLVYVSDESPGIRRRKAGKAFAYLKPDGSRLTEPAALGRIKSLAIPPAYTDVWICPKPNGHIQATGRDAKGRKQYRYHPAFREVRESTKYGHMLEFAASLPAIRKTIEAHMALRGLPREKVLATVVHLLETTLIRVGNSDYAKQNKSYGLTTLRDPHVKVNGGELRFQFKGKSSKTWQLQRSRTGASPRSSRPARTFRGRTCSSISTRTASGRRSPPPTSTPTSARSPAATSPRRIFGPGPGTVLAAMALTEFESFDSEAKAKRNVRAAIERVAARLGNTPTICRKCYVHPEVLTCYLDGGCLLEVREEARGRTASMTFPGLRPEEAAVLTLLAARLEPGPRARDARPRRTPPRGAPKAREPRKQGAAQSGLRRCGRPADPPSRADPARRPRLR